MITATPSAHNDAPTQSAVSGRWPSSHQPHSNDKTTNTPPYAAYTRPKWAGWSRDDAIQEEQQSAKSTNEKPAPFPKPKPHEIPTAYFHRASQQEERDRADHRHRLGVRRLHDT